MSAAKHDAISFETVADYPDVAVSTSGRESLDRTLEAVEDMSRPVTRRDLERLVVVVAAHVTGSHLSLRLVLNHTATVFPHICESLQVTTLSVS